MITRMRMKKVQITMTRTIEVPENIDELPMNEALEYLKHGDTVVTVKDIPDGHDIQTSGH